MSIILACPNNASTFGREIFGTPKRDYTLSNVMILPYFNSRSNEHATLRPYKQGYYSLNISLFGKSARQ